MRGYITYLFLSQRAMLFVGGAQRRATKEKEVETYVRIIKEVDAATMARFPVNFAQNVGHIRWERVGQTLTELNMYNP